MKRILEVILMLPAKNCFHLVQSAFLSCSIYPRIIYVCLTVFAYSTHSPYIAKIPSSSTVRLHLMQ